MECAPVLRVQPRGLCWDMAFVTQFLGRGWSIMGQHCSVAGGEGLNFCQELHSSVALPAPGQVLILLTRSEERLATPLAPCHQQPLGEVTLDQAAGCSTARFLSGAGLHTHCPLHGAIACSLVSSAFSSGILWKEQLSCFSLIQSVLMSV